MLCKLSTQRGLDYFVCFFSLPLSYRLSSFSLDINPMNWDWQTRGKNTFFPSTPINLIYSSFFSSSSSIFFKSSLLSQTKQDDKKKKLFDSLNSIVLFCEYKVKMKTNKKIIEWKFHRTPQKFLIDSVSSTTSWEFKLTSFDGMLNNLFCEMKTLKVKSNLI